MKIEFSVGDRVTYFDGTGGVFSAKIHRVFMNPVTSDVEYILMYKSGNGYVKVTTGPARIRESSRCGEDKHEKSKHAKCSRAY